jgi:hypothetical protein
MPDHYDDEFTFRERAHNFRQAVETDPSAARSTLIRYATLTRDPALTTHIENTIGEDYSFEGMSDKDVIQFLEKVRDYQVDQPTVKQAAERSLDEMSEADLFSEFMGNRPGAPKPGDVPLSERAAVTGQRSSEFWQESGRRMKAKINGVVGDVLEALTPDSGGFDAGNENKRVMQEYQGITAEKGKKTLLARAQDIVEPGESLGNAMKRATALMRQEAGKQGKRAKFASEGEASEATFTPTERQAEYGIHERAEIGQSIKSDFTSQKIRRIADRRARQMAEGGAAGGLTSGELRPLPKPEPKPKAESKKGKLNEAAAQKEADIRDLMDSLGVDRETAIEIWERNRAQDGEIRRPTS